MNSTRSTLSSWRQGILDSLPITVSIILFGAIFGMLSLQAGLTAGQTLLMSLLVYAGSAQFTALSMISEHASLWAIVLATFLLNSRHLLMGLSISPHYQKFTGRQISLFAFFLTDEQYAISLNRFRHHPSDAGYVTSVCLSLYLGWFLGTCLGTVAGRWIPDPEALGLGFSFTAMFLALAYYQLTSVIRILTFLLCGAVAVCMSFLLPSGLHLLIAGIIAFAIGYAMPNRDEQPQQDAVSREVETA